MKTYPLFLLLIFPLFLNAQVTTSGEQDTLPPDLLEQVQIILQNENYNKIFKGIKSLFQSDDRPFVVGSAVKNKFNLVKQGATFVQGGEKHYVVKYEIADADSVASVHIAFRKYYFSEGTLRITDGQGNNQQTLVDSKSKKRGRKYISAKIPGNSIIVIYSVPEGVNKPDACLIIDRMGYFYKTGVTVGGMLEDCYLNAACKPLGGMEHAVVKWEYYDPKDNNYKVCTGTLVSKNGTVSPEPFLLTACHCGVKGQYETAVFYFRYQQDACNVGSPSPVRQDLYAIEGARNISSSKKNDVRLLKLSGLPSSLSLSNFATWDLGNQTSSSPVVTFHHPQGREKAVTLGTLQNSSGDYWSVQWDGRSTTMKGSSGGPLFLNGKIIGVLSGGLSGCNNLLGIDKYGKLQKAWSKIKKHLDP